MDVGKDGAAELAGLQVGDRIAKIENKIPDKFSKKTDTGLSGPQDLLGRRLDKKAGSNSRLSIEVLRGQETQKLNIQSTKKFIFFFFKSSILFKKNKFLSDIAKQLVKTQQANGRWKPGVGGDADVYTTCVLWTGSFS